MIVSWWHRWVERRERKQAQERLFAVGPDGEWPPTAVILPGGLPGLRGTYGDGAMRQPSGPRTGPDGRPRYFAGEDE